jgi:hypothetical protein
MSEPQLSPQRLRTLCVMKILLRYSDEEHILSASDIVGYLRTCGLDAERKAIYSDIKYPSPVRNGYRDDSEGRILPELPGV